MMYGTIPKWGNSHGIRIPKSVLAAAQMNENDDVEIIVTQEAITLLQSWGRFRAR